MSTTVPSAVMNRTKMAHFRSASWIRLSSPILIWMSRRTFDSTSRHKTVTLTLLDRAHTVIGGHDITDDLVETRNRSRHHLGLGLPQPRRTLHVSQQQRHRARRQKPTHAKIAPVHQRLTRTR